MRYYKAKLEEQWEITFSAEDYRNLKLAQLPDGRYGKVIPVKLRDGDKKKRYFVLYPISEFEIVKEKK